MTFIFKYILKLYDIRMPQSENKSKNFHHEIIDIGKKMVNPITESFETLTY